MFTMKFNASDVNLIFPLKCGLGIGYGISRKCQPIWVSVLVSDPNQNSGLGHTLVTIYRTAWQPYKLSHMIPFVSIYPIHPRTNPWNFCEKLATFNWFVLFIPWNEYISYDQFEKLVENSLQSNNKYLGEAAQMKVDKWYSEVSLKSAIFIQQSLTTIVASALKKCIKWC